MAWTRCSCISRLSSPAYTDSGVLIGGGNMCKRELADLEVERRELDLGGSVLAALGLLPANSTLTKRSDSGDAATSGSSLLHQMLVTREIGQIAEQLGVRALGHDEAQEVFRRDVGLECAGDVHECNDLYKRNAADAIRQYAEHLGLLAM